MLQFVLGNPHPGTSSRKDKQILGSASKSSLPISKSPVLPAGQKIHMGKGLGATAKLGNGTNSGGRKCRGLRAADKTLLL